MAQKILIFDFDGTIADSHSYIIKIANQLAPEFKYNLISSEETNALRNKSSKEIIQHLEVPLMKIPSILTRAKKEFYKGLDTLKPFDGIKETLLQLKESNRSMGILSSNSSENVNQFLENHDLKLFDFIHTTSKVWTKNTSLKKLVQKKGYLLEDILYIGDEIRDIVAANKLGIDIIAVGWGYNSEAALSKHNPSHLAQTPEELLELCTKHY